MDDNLLHIKCALINATGAAEMHIKRLYDVTVFRFYDLPVPFVVPNFS